MKISSSRSCRFCGRWRRRACVSIKSFLPCSQRSITRSSINRKNIYKAAGEEFNINSPKQLGDILFDKLGLKPARQKKTATGARSTRESELEKMRDGCIRSLQTFCSIASFKTCSVPISTTPDLARRAEPRAHHFIQLVQQQGVSLLKTRASKISRSKQSLGRADPQSVYRREGHM
jgi:hypothetical protein